MRVPEFDDEIGDAVMVALIGCGSALWGALALAAALEGDVREAIQSLATVGMGWSVLGGYRAGIRAINRRRDRAIARLEQRRRFGPGPRGGG